MPVQDFYRMRKEKGFTKETGEGLGRESGESGTERGRNIIMYWHIFNIIFKLNSNGKVGNGNILRDDTGHLKVADFGVSKVLKVSKTVKEDRPVPGQETSWRYVAPEVLRKEEYDTKVDVFSFALIFQEDRFRFALSSCSVVFQMIEGCPPFASKPEEEVPTAYCSNERPPFRAPAKSSPN
ncbi:hypothetical protein Cgig2_030087 [Carnegiea gigantea]|uniref:Protein kinase domain-containing protein n=1 Tax=Carnegiea gigantea TaxID=171969 RepID=A0A9Q1GY51_9CARY|nr:hypothetical protein Cgig2_030087 [Carnegiea gigantea]